MSVGSSEPAVLAETGGNSRILDRCLALFDTRSPRVVGVGPAECHRITSATSKLVGRRLPSGLGCPFSEVTGVNGHVRGGVATMTRMSVERMTRCSPFGVFRPMALLPTNERWQNLGMTPQRVLALDWRTVVVSGGTRD